jgi:hypothetical protein
VAPNWSWNSRFRCLTLGRRTTFGNVKADVLAWFVPGFERRISDVIEESYWPE